MVSNLAILAMVISVILAIGFPIVLVIYFIIKYKRDHKPIMVGVLIYIIFAIILEQVLHGFVFTNSIFSQNPLIYAIYGGLAAGVFEETGRLFAYKVIMKKSRQWKDSIAYGIGHGGIESLIMGISLIPNITYANLINSGKFENSFVDIASKSQLLQIKSTILNKSAILYLLPGTQRVMTLLFQIALSLLVMYALKKRKYIFYVLAIVLHGLVYFPAILYDKGVGNVWIVEIVMIIAGVTSVIFIIRSKKLFLEKSTILTNN